MQHNNPVSSPPSPLAEHPPSGAYRVVVGMLPLWGLLLMLAMLNYPLISRDLWTDEAYTVSYTVHPTMSALLEDVRKNEETPPLYFMSVWLWSRAFGTSEVAIRVLSVIYGAGSVLGFAAFIRQRLSPDAAVVAVVLMAASPLFQRYLTEARGCDDPGRRDPVSDCDPARLGHRRWGRVCRAP